MFDRLEDLLIRFEEIMSELHEPTVTSNQERFRKLMKEQSDLTPIVNAYTVLFLITRRGLDLDLHFHT